VNIKINERKIAQLGTPAGPVGKWVRSKVRETTMVARIEAPSRTGRLRNSIGDYYLGGNRYAIRTKVPYARYVYFGTAPHEIVPRRPGGYLRFFWEKAGAVVYRKRVWHPGITKPNNFLERAVDKVFGPYFR